MPSPRALTFEVDRAELRRTRWAEERPVDGEALAAGQVAVRVERFALTANNVTYAIADDRFSYWSFFPAQAPWGRIPAWGVGQVVASRNAGIREGERVFGYLPVGTQLVMDPGSAGPGHLIDAAPHRAKLIPVYNFYLRLTANSDYDPRWDGHLALLRPLVMTGLVLAQHMAEARAFGARRIVLASASSKTALATAFLLSREASAPWEVVGLTSPGNAEFCRRTGYYGRVLSYEEIATLPAGVPTALLDMAGNASVRTEIHGHLRDDLTYSGQVGWTHWEQGQAGAPLPGIAPEFFSSMEHIRRRVREWGADGFEERFQAAWRAFLPASEAWLRMVHGHGPAAVERVYQALLDGQARPDEGHVLSL